MTGFSRSAYRLLHTAGGRILSDNPTSFFGKPGSPNLQNLHEDNGQTERSSVHLSEVIGAISFALDLTEGQPPGHCLRSCLIGMRLAHSFNLDQQERSDLYYTILLKDAGCSSNAARLWDLYGSDDRQIKSDFKTVDSQRLIPLARFVFRHAGRGEPLTKKLKRLLLLSRFGDTLATELVQTRCERGAEIAGHLGFGKRVSEGIYSLDEHWNGKGRPQRLSGDRIPFGSRIALLSQVIDVFHHLGGPDRAIGEVVRRKGSWFDPEMVDAFLTFSSDPAFWNSLKEEGLQERVERLEPEEILLSMDSDLIDRISEVFARIIDNKSPYTHDHSRRVAYYGEHLGKAMGLSESATQWIRRGALLHDLGKLGISNAILDKPGKLDQQEWDEMRKHSLYTEEILRRIRICSHLSKIAGNHHEKLNGSGYPHKISEEEILCETRVITTSDIFDALTAARPYRGPIPPSKAMEIMEREVGLAIDDKCFKALKECLPDFSLNP